MPIKDVALGRNVRIVDESLVNLYGCAIGDDTMIGPMQSSADWTVDRTVVGRRASIGSNATLLAGITIGEGALVGAGAVVTKDVQPFTIVAGVPAQVVGDVRTVKRASDADLTTNRTRRMG